MGLYKRPESPIWYYEFEFKGKRYRGSTGTANKRDAETRMAEVRAEAQEDAKLVGKKRMTLRDLAKVWLEHAEVELGDFKNNQSRVRKLFGYELVEGQEVKRREGLPEDLLVQKLTQRHLMELKTARLREGNSGSTINREMSLIQAMLKLGKRAGVVMPQEDLEFAELKSREAKGKLRYITPEEEAMLLETLQARLERHKNPLIQDQIDLVIFLLDTGARYDEVASIMWDAVDLENRVINLYRSKVGNESDLAMTDRLYEVLVRRRDATRGRRYIFPSGHSHSWAPEDKPRGHATKGIQKAIDEAGLNEEAKVKRFGRVTPHTFRHTFASRLVQAGKSLYQVQVLLGHASSTTSQRYAKLAMRPLARETAETLTAINEQTQAARERVARSVRGEAELES